MQTSDINAFASCTSAMSLLNIDGSRHDILQTADIYHEQLIAAFEALVLGTSELID